MTVDHKLCAAALTECDTTSFEKFIQAFHASLVGHSFVPVGGMHDGGADGLEETVFSSTKRVGTFLQASKTEDPEKKIKATIKRLISAGREPKVVIFYFSVSIAKPDAMEEAAYDDFDVTVRVRGRQYIEAHINDNVQGQQAFDSYLKPSAAHLLIMGGGQDDKGFPFAEKALCTFLGQEVNRRRGNATLLTSVADALILWSLEDTDPDQRLYLKRQQILDRIETAIPSSKQFMRGVIDARLAALRSKKGTGGRQITWDAKIHSYSLRFEQRQALIAMNVEENALFKSVLDEFREALRERVPSSLHNRMADIVSVVNKVIQNMFQQNGIALGLSLRDNDDTYLDEIRVNDFIDTEVDTLSLNAKDRNSVREAVFRLIASILYKPSQSQHKYMLRLSSTYFLLFALKNDPKVVEYFNHLAGQLTLYVGSDLIIKALSEYHLPESAKMVTNSLRIIKQSGARLIMAEPAFEEVYTHLKAANAEFENFYAVVEPEIDESFVFAIDRILIRSYFYARLGINTEGRAPQGWKSYIGQFCNYNELRLGRNRNGLRNYLVDKFEMQYEEKTAMQTLIERDDLRRLKNQLASQRLGRARNPSRNEVLAHNDALHALRVFARRREHGEETKQGPFGYKTWWLTHERTVQSAVAAVFGNDRPRFIMRPEFMLNYIYLMPTKNEVANSFSEIFPTILGVSLSKRADPQVLHEVLRSARDAYAVDASRARVMLSGYVDQLKGDLLRKYETKIDDSVLDRTIDVEAE